MPSKFEEFKANTKLGTDSHQGVDVDGDANSIHHTLGSRSDQAAPGNHKHREHDFPLQQVQITPPQVIPAAVFTKVTNWLFHAHKYPNFDYPGPGDFRLPEDGYWIIKFRALMLPIGVSNKVNVRITVNGSIAWQDENIVWASNYQTVFTDYESSLKKGDIISIWLYTYNSQSTHENPVYTNLTMRKIRDTY